MTNKITTQAMESGLVPIRLVYEPTNTTSLRSVKNRNKRFKYAIHYPLVCKMDETEKAYIAGFFDGEGCIYIGKVRTRNTETITGRILIGGTNKEEINYLFNLIKNGRKNETQHSNRQNNKKMYRIELAQSQGIIFLREILPYLKLKKQQANLFIELSELKKKSSRKGKYNIKRQEEIMEENKKLNRRGI